MQAICGGCDAAMRSMIRLSSPFTRRSYALLLGIQANQRLSRITWTCHEIRCRRLKHGTSQCQCGIRIYKDKWVSQAIKASVIQYNKNQNSLLLCRSHLSVMQAVCSSVSQEKRQRRHLESCLGKWSGERAKTMVSVISKAVCMPPPHGSTGTAAIQKVVCHTGHHASALRLQHYAAAWLALCLRPDIVPSL